MSSYYKVNGHEAIELIDLLECDFNLGNAIKYVWRAGLKPGVDKSQDLQKARYYVKKITNLGKWELVEDKTNLFTEMVEIIKTAFPTCTELYKQNALSMLVNSVYTDNPQTISEVLYHIDRMEGK